MQYHVRKKYFAYLLNAKYTDFEIRLPGYKFKVHRIIIASQSSYFDNLCSGSFMEASIGFVNLDVDPTEMAALLIGIYVGSYTGHDAVLKLLQGASSSEQTLLSSVRTTTMRTTFHAAMYRTAEAYDTACVKRIAAQNFVSALHSETFTFQSLIDTIKALYVECVTFEDEIRAPVIFMAQKLQRQLCTIPAFLKLIEDVPPFAIDLLTLYRASNYIYCPECDTEIELVECECGFNGLCGYKYCTSQDFTQMRCTSCGRKGHLLKQAPTTDKSKESSLLTAFVRTSLADELVRSTSSPETKKRRSS